MTQTKSGYKRTQITRVCRTFSFAYETQNVTNPHLVSLVHQGKTKKIVSQFISLFGVNMIMTMVFPTRTFIDPHPSFHNPVIRQQVRSVLTFQKWFLPRQKGGLSHPKVNQLNKRNQTNQQKPTKKKRGGPITTNPQKSLNNRHFTSTYKSSLRRVKVLLYYLYRYQ